MFCDVALDPLALSLCGGRCVPQMEKNYWENINYLKAKIDAGGEMVVTQLFYDTDIFFKFVKDCRSVGIDVPILPGIMPIMTYGGFKRMTGFCKTKVPKDLADKVGSSA